MMESATRTRQPAHDDAYPLDLSRIKRVAWVVLGLQLVGLIVFSAIQYERFSLTKDFAVYAQALWLIAHGHLDPYSTLVGAPFWRSDAEFILWPLSLMYKVIPTPFILLPVQDIAVVLTELVTFLWIADLLETKRHSLSRRTSQMIAVGSLLVLVLNPWVYNTAAFDFHTHVLAALFIVIAGRDLWSGRLRRMWIWVALAVLCNALGALYVAGLGLTGLLASRRTRLAGLGLLVVGAAYFLVITTLGGDGAGGNGVATWFGYLVGPHHGKISIFDVIVGAIRHPGLVGHMFARRWSVIFDFLLPFGLIGAFSPWALGMALVVFVPNTLTASTNFLRFDVSFQSWAALPFVLFGSISILVSLLGREGAFRRLGAYTSAAWAVCVFVLAFLVMPAIPRYWISVGPRASAVLSDVEAQLPAHTEVVASSGVVGRFGERQYVYVLGLSPSGRVGFNTPVPIHRHAIVFIVAPNQGVEGWLHNVYDRAVPVLRYRLHARTVAAGDGIYVFEVVLPTSVHSLVVA